MRKTINTVFPHYSHTVRCSHAYLVKVEILAGRQKYLEERLGIARVHAVEQQHIGRSASSGTTTTAIIRTTTTTGTNTSRSSSS